MQRERGRPAPIVWRVQPFDWSASSSQERYFPPESVLPNQRAGDRGGQRDSCGRHHDQAECRNERLVNRPPSATLASLRYADLPEGVAQAMTVDDALLETLERLHDYDDEAPGSEAFVRDLLLRVRLWGRHELWRVLLSGDMSADELLAELQRRDECR